MDAFKSHVDVDEKETVVYHNSLTEGVGYPSQKAHDMITAQIILQGAGFTEPVIVIPMSYFNELEDNAAELQALDAMGVDNWGGYGEAMRYKQDQEEAAALERQERADD